MEDMVSCAPLSRKGIIFHKVLRRSSMTLSHLNCPLTFPTLSACHVWRVPAAAKEDSKALIGPHNTQPSSLKRENAAMVIPDGMEK